MKNIQGGRGWLKRFFYSGFFALLLLILIFFLARSAWQMGRRYQIVVEDRSALESRISALEDRRSALDREIDKLKTERGLDEAIRKKFPVAKEGERVIMIIAPDEPPATTTPAEPSWWEKVLNLFR